MNKNAPVRWRTPGVLSADTLLVVIGGELRRTVIGHWSLLREGRRQMTDDRIEMINYRQHTTGTRQQLFVILDIVICNLYFVFLK